MCVRKPSFLISKQSTPPRSRLRIFLTRYRLEQALYYKGVYVHPTKYLRVNINPSLVHKLADLQQLRVPLPLRLHDRLPPLIPHLLAIRQLDQLLHLLQREHLLRQPL